MLPIIIITTNQKLLFSLYSLYSRDWTCCSQSLISLGDNSQGHFYCPLSIFIFEIFQKFRFLTGFVNHIPKEGCLLQYIQQNDWTTCRLTGSGLSCSSQSCDAFCSLCILSDYSLWVWSFPYCNLKGNNESLDDNSETSHVKLINIS